MKRNPQSIAVQPGHCRAGSGHAMSSLSSRTEGPLDRAACQHASTSAMAADIEYCYDQRVNRSLAPRYAVARLDKIRSKVSAALLRSSAWTMSERA